MRMLLDLDEDLLDRIEKFRFCSAQELGIKLTRRPAIMMLLKIALDITEDPGDEPEREALQ